MSFEAGLRGKKLNVLYICIVKTKREIRRKLMMVLFENLNCGICNIVMERGVRFDILWFMKN